MRDFLKVVLLIPALFATLSALTFLLLRDWQYANWFAWSLHFALSVFVWFPFVLVPYLKRGRVA